MHFGKWEMQKMFQSNRLNGMDCTGEYVRKIKMIHILVYSRINKDRYNILTAPWYSIKPND
jgi:hypothetical protein